MKVQPLNDRALVRPAKEPDRSKGGIALPDNARDKPHKGEVLAVGPGLLYDQPTAGNYKPVYRPMPVVVGDVIVFSRYAGGESRDLDELDGCLLVAATDILAVVVKE